MAKRSVAQATISFGLVAIPVKFYLSASAENINFNMITKDGNRVKQELVDAVTGATVDRASTQKGYEYAKGQYVIFTKDELKSLGEGDSGSMEIVEFVPNSLDLMHVEQTYYLDAGKGGDKAYRLLHAALKRQEKLAVAQWTNRGKQHLIVIGIKGDALVAHQMYYNTEVRDFELDCATYTPRDAEVDMACKLVEALSSETFDSSKYTNTFNEKVIKAAEAKKAGGSVPVDEPEAEPVGDLFAALQASLAGDGKPAAAPKKSKKGNAA